MIDLLVVGAGAAGAVLAAGLSDHPGDDVLLVEAGPDYPDEQTVPPALADAYTDSGHGHDWARLARMGLAPSVAAFVSVETDRQFG